jgi:hypothetical protein
MNPFDKKEISTEVAEKSQVGLAITKAGITGDRAKLLRDMFLPFEIQATELADKAYALVVTDESQTDLMKQGKEGRETMRKIRLDIERRHKEGKADALKEGQLYDLIKRVLLSLVTPLEEHYGKQEKFAEVQQEKRRQESYSERLIALSAYMPAEQAKTLPLGDLSPEAFEITLEGAKSMVEKRKREEEEAARIRDEEQKRQREEQDRIRAENERLRNEQAERDRKERILNSRMAAICNMIAPEEDDEGNMLFKIKHAEVDTVYTNSEEIRNATDSEWSALIGRVRAVYLRIQQDEQIRLNKIEEQRRQEKDKREKAEKELRDKTEKEEADKKAAAAEKRKVQRAPDRDKLLLLADAIEAIKLPSVKDEDAQKILAGITEMLGKAVKWTREQVDKKL